MSSMFLAAIFTRQLLQRVPLSILLWGLAAVLGCGDLREVLKSICDEEVRFRKSLPVGFVEQDELIDSLKEQLSELLSVFRESEF